MDAILEPSTRRLGTSALSKCSIHVLRGYEQSISTRFRSESILIIFNLQDLPGTIEKVAKFLGKSLTDTDASKLAEYLSIDNFKHNPAVNQNELRDVRILNITTEGFVRNGKTVLNGWQKEYNSPELIERVQRWMETNLQQTDLKFPM